jgi:DNA-binding SARP family transcriptional activator
MEFRILGPLEILEKGERVPVAGSKQRALLAMLLLHANRVVSRNRLIDALWEEQPPETAAKALQVHVSQLRKVLGADRIVTRTPGYLLRVAPGELDLERFERLVEEGDRDQLTQALALWRGQPLADLADERFAQGEIARLEELRLVALEERIEADLALGRDADLVGELEALVAEHPLRERLRAQLMVALYRSRRQAEALEVYQDARRALVEELGIDPGRALRELEQAILRQEPSLELLEAAVAGPARGVFVGRERELGELLAGLEDALDGHGGVVLISGEPGIGKSRLTDELADLARKRGARILVGRAWEAGGAPAFWPWVQALRSYIQETEPQLLRSQVGSGAADLAQLLPELRDVLADVPDARLADPEGARFRLFDAVAAFLKSAARAKPLVLALDDVHAADTPSLLLLQFLGGEVPTSRILIVAAYRDIDPMLTDPLSSTVAELTRGRATRLLPLSGLPEPAVASFIEKAAGVEPPAGLAGAIHRETEGNPFFVGEVLRLLVSEGGLAERLLEESARLTIPHNVRAVIGRRLARLSAECRRVLSLASVLGREFRLDALERVSELPGEELLGVLDEAVPERVVAEVPGGIGRLRFSHALIRETLYDELSPSRRVSLHRRVGEALESLYGQRPESHLAELAYHFFEAAPGGDAAKAVEYARRAADRAVGLLAYEEAVRLYRIALDALDSKGAADQTTRCELLLALGDARARAGDEPEAKGTFFEAATLARALEAPELLARAALGYGGRFPWARAGRDTQLVPLLEDALNALGEAESPLRVRVLTRLAGALRDQHDRAPRAALSAEAVEMARRTGDSTALTYALDGRCTAIFWPENTNERLALADELIALAAELGDRERVAQARYLRAMFLFEFGDVLGAKADLERYALLAEELKQPAQRWLLVATRATLAVFEGRFQEAEELMETAIALGERAQGSDAVLSHRIQLFTLGLLRGEVDGLEELLRRSIDDYPARPMFRCMLARLYAELGRESEARAVSDDLAANDFAALPLTNEWLFSMGFLAEVTALLGDAEVAQTMHGLLLPYASLNASTADYIATGSVSRSLGILASVLRRSGEAQRHFESALELNERMGARPWVAQTEHDYARMLLTRDEAGDREQAAQLLARAMTTYRELGMDRFAARASALREPARARP